MKLVPCPMYSYYQRGRSAGGVVCMLCACSRVVPVALVVEFKLKGLDDFVIETHDELTAFHRELKELRKTHLEA